MAENGVIGRGGQLPWRLAADLKRFKQLTMGHTLIMGRKTWESIGRPLPGRGMVVISRQAGYAAEGADVVANLDRALKIAAEAGDEEAFVIGGAEIYRLAIPHADRIYLTLVLAEVEGDTRFPEVNWDDWQRIDADSHPADNENDHAHVFHVFDRLPVAESHRKAGA